LLLGRPFFIIIGHSFAYLSPALPPKKNQLKTIEFSTSIDKAPVIYNNSLFDVNQHYYKHTQNIKCAYMSNYKDHRENSYIKIKTSSSPGTSLDRFESCNRHRIVGIHHREKSMRVW
jgi:hypothetical protein